MTEKFKYKYAQYSPLTEEDIEMIHETSLNLLSNHGIRVIGEEAHQVYASAGCEIDKEKDLVRIPKNIVNDCIRSAPSKYTLCARDPDKDVEIGGDEDTVYTTFSTGVSIYDLNTGELKDSTLEDLKQITRLADSLDEVGKVSLTIEAQDIPAEVRNFYEAEAVFSNSSKHFSHDTEGKYMTQKIIEMAAVVAGGKENLKKRPLISFAACPNSPLEIHKNETEQIMEAAKASIPINVLSMGLCGGTTPATLAGTLAITNSEVLGGIVLAQLTNKGAPAIYGSSTTIMDMRTTTTPVGSPEHAMISASAAQIGQYYGIPTDVGGT